MNKLVTGLILFVLVALAFFYFKPASEQLTAQVELDAFTTTEDVKYFDSYWFAYHPDTIVIE